MKVAILTTDNREFFEDYEGVKDFARGCMRTYLILKEKAARFNADSEIQTLLAQINADDGSLDYLKGGKVDEKGFTAARNQCGDRIKALGRKLKG